MKILFNLFKSETKLTIKILKNIYILFKIKQIKVKKKQIIRN